MVTQKPSKSAVKPPKASAAKLKAAVPEKVSVKSKNTNKNNEIKNTPVPPEGWLQDASLEIPVPPTASYNQAGKRELEFSVGLRQQEGDDLVRSELRARALIHVEGAILAIAEASFINVLLKDQVPPDIASKLYEGLRPHMESILAMGGHKPPLPLTLDKIL